MNKIKNNKGFTIMEVLVAMMITSIALIVVLSTVHLGWKTWKVSGKELELYAQISIALQTITGDIRSTVMPPIIWPTNPENADERRYYSFIGGVENIEFFAYSPDTVFIGGLMRRKSVICQIKYEIQEDSNEYEGIRKKFLRFLTHDDFSEISYQRRTEELVNGISEVTFKYFDSEKNIWVSEWDSRKDPLIKERFPLQKRIPKAVQITLEAESKDELAEARPKLVTTVYLPASRL